MVQMVDQVVQVVDLEPDLPLVFERPRLLISRVEIHREAPEEPRHREIRLTMSEVRRRVYERRMTVTRGDEVSRPEITVNHARFRMHRKIGVQLIANPLQRSLPGILPDAGLLRAPYLRLYAACPKELRPICLPLVLLGKASDVVGSMESIPFRGVPVEVGQVMPEGLPKPFRCDTGFDPFEEEDAGFSIATVDDDQRFGYSDGGACFAESPQSGRLGSKGACRLFPTPLQKVCTGVRSEARRVGDAAATQTISSLDDFA